MALGVDARVRWRSDGAEEPKRDARELEGDIQDVDRAAEDMGDTSQRSLDRMDAGWVKNIAGAGAMLGVLRQVIQYMERLQDLARGSVETTAQILIESNLLGVDFQTGQTLNELLQPFGEDIRSVGDTIAQIEDRILEGTDLDAIQEVGIPLNFGQLGTVEQIRTLSQIDPSAGNNQALLDRIGGGDRRVISALNILQQEDVDFLDQAVAFERAGLSIDQQQAQRIVVDETLGQAGQRIRDRRTGLAAADLGFTEGEGIAGVPGPFIRPVAEAVGVERVTDTLGVTREPTVDARNRPASWNDQWLTQQSFTKQAGNGS